MAAFDCIIRGGTIVDGTGGTPFTGDVAIRDGLIAQVGRVEGEADEEIDANGLMVTPASSISIPIMTVRQPGIRRWRHPAGTASPPS